MRSGAREARKIGWLSLAALALALLGPGVATVSAKPSPRLTVLKRGVAVAPALPVSAAPLVVAVAPAEPSAAPVVAKRRLRRLKQSELNPSLMQASAELIKKHHAKRFGTEVDVEIVGKRYVARVERHFHPEGGAIKPWGHHPGISLFAVD